MFVASEDFYDYALSKVAFSRGANIFKFKDL
jgi:hypothetical protein